VNDVDRLKQRLIEGWSGLWQTVVEKAIDEWKRSFWACSHENGYQFENLL